ncbi:OLC1v1003037C1 [Oldenlandia corymbosa var. corymbosa]|uniref:OLC1v1003037C1 n=1 Tax=Oldenlandia corymbosa var. corymbosa TaxID=529605 RepID=A0AAV1DBI0_OLDCO|nr:OLC1v1003037C1 [Oldenlandia corymbosa var. corymbosa]
MEAPAPPSLDPSATQQQPPPMAMATQQAYSANTGHGSAGPVIGVLAVITILGAAAVMIGRICSGRGIFGRGPRYDLESWVETKCSSCVDGRIDSPAPRRIVVEHSNSSRPGEAAGPPPPPLEEAAPGVARVVEERPDDDQETIEEETETLSPNHAQRHHITTNHNRPIHPLERRKDEGP